MNDNSNHTPGDEPTQPSPITVEALQEVEGAIAAFKAAAVALQAIGDADAALRSAGFALAFAGHRHAMATACELADFASDFREELLAHEVFRVHARARGALRTAANPLEEQCWQPSR